MVKIKLEQSKGNLCKFEKVPKSTLCHVCKDDTNQRSVESDEKDEKLSARLSDEDSIEKQLKERTAESVSICKEFVWSRWAMWGLVIFIQCLPGLADRAENLREEIEFLSAGLEKK